VSHDLGSVSARLKGLRETRGISRYRLAKVSGVSETYIYRIEKGLIKNPRRDTLQKLSHGLGITLAQLIGEVTPGDTWGLVEQSLKAYIPVYSGIGEFMEPIDYVVCTRAKVPPETVRAYRSNGFCFDPDIHSGDTLIVDTSLVPMDRDFVIGVTEGLATVMRYREEGEDRWFEDNGGRHEAEGVETHGVVTDYQRKLRQKGGRLPG
jgi:transcriptional regulator with XRE-family HTH domain